MNRLTITEVLLASVLLGLNGGCGVDLGDAPGVGGKDSAIYAALDTKWQDGLIPVCWESSASAFSTQRAWVEDAIDRSWGRAANVRFLG